MNRNLLAPRPALLNPLPPLVALATLFAFNACAQVFQLVVDDSNPSAVTITATGAFSAVDAGNGSAQGVVLDSFFGSPQIAVALPVNGTSLKVPGSSLLDSVNPTDLGGGQIDLELYRSGVSPLGQTFSTTSPAFQGSLLVDMSASASALPGVGATGSIVAFNFGSNPVVGQWIVVPEPGSYAVVAGIGLVGFAIWRRRNG